MTITLCRCGNDEWRTVYDRVPYGATMVRMAVDEVCTNCGASIEYAEEVCEECMASVDDCQCEEDEDDYSATIDTLMSTAS